MPTFHPEKHLFAFSIESFILSILAACASPLPPTQSQSEPLPSASVDELRAIHLNPSERSSAESAAICDQIANQLAANNVSPFTELSSEQPDAETGMIDLGEISTDEEYFIKEINLAIAQLERAGLPQDLIDILTEYAQDITQLIQEGRFVVVFTDDPSLSPVNYFSADQSDQNFNCSIAIIPQGLFSDISQIGFLFHEGVHAVDKAKCAQEKCQVSDDEALASFLGNIMENGARLAANNQNQIKNDQKQYLSLFGYDPAAVDFFLAQNGYSYDNDLSTYISDLGTARLAVASVQQTDQVIEYIFATASQDGDQELLAKLKKNRDSSMALVNFFSTKWEKHLWKETELTLMTEMVELGLVPPDFFNLSSLEEIIPSPCADLDCQPIDQQALLHPTILLETASREDIDRACQQLADTVGVSLPATEDPELINKFSLLVFQLSAHTQLSQETIATLSEYAQAFRLLAEEGRIRVIAGNPGFPSRTDFFVDPNNPDAFCAIISLNPDSPTDSTRIRTEGHELFHAVAFAMGAQQGKEAFNQITEPMANWLGYLFEAAFRTNLAPETVTAEINRYLSLGNVDLPSVYLYLAEQDYPYYGPFINFIFEGRQAYLAKSLIDIQQATIDALEKQPALERDQQMLDQTRASLEQNQASWQQFIEKWTSFPWNGNDYRLMNEMLTNGSVTPDFWTTLLPKNTSSR